MQRMGRGIVMGTSSVKKTKHFHEKRPTVTSTIEKIVIVEAELSTRK